MLDILLTVPTWQDGCIEEMVIIDETNEVYKYSFSNNLDNIREAIYARTGKNINLEEALWKQNNKLSISVKRLMNFHNVNFSMTTDTMGKVRFVEVNMRVGDKWFNTGYDENKGKFENWYINIKRNLLISFIDQVLHMSLSDILS